MLTLWTNLSFDPFLMKFFYLIFFLAPLVTFSQIEDAAKRFDSVFYDIAVNISSNNPNRAMHLADSLLVNAQNESKK